MITEESRQKAPYCLNVGVTYSCRQHGTTQRWFWILVFFAAAWFGPCLAWGQESKPKRVLLLYSHEREMAMYAGLDHGLRSALESGSPYPVEFYAEYLDLIRFPDKPRQRKSVDYLRVKYADRGIDLVIAISPLAFDFIFRHSDELFPGIPIVFTSVNTTRIDELSLGPNITGIAVTRDITQTLDLVLRLQPDTTRVVIPVGTSPTERSWAADTRKIFQPYEDRVAFSYLADLSMSDIVEHVKRLPPHTVVLFTPLFFYDAAGQYFLPEEALEQISRHSSAPVYGTDVHYLGAGIVGGVLYDLTPAGVAAGRVGQRILAGEKPATIPVQTLDPNYRMFDARQLARWSISEDRLPPGSEIRFREPGAWKRYRLYIVGAISLFVLQAGLIAGLIVQGARRKRVEVALRESEERFHVMADTAPVMVWRSGTDKLCDFFNRPWLEFTGRSMAQEAGYGWAEGVHPDDLEQCLRTFGDAFDARVPFRMEYRLKRADGEYRWVLDSGVCRLAPDGSFAGYIGSCLDITERKRGEEALRESETALRTSHSRIEDLAGRLITAQEAERSRIARDLHDDVCQEAAGMSVFISNLKHRRGQIQDPETQKALTSLQDRTVSLAESLRRLSHDLHPSTLEHVGLVAALEAQCLEVERQHDIQVSLSAGEDLGSIDSEAALCLYRIAQEALRNTSRHADARHAWVSLVRCGDSLELTIADDGRGFDLTRARRDRSGLGLVSIEERARLANATMSIDTEPQHGTTLEVRIPVEPRATRAVTSEAVELSAARDE